MDEKKKRPQATIAEKLGAHWEALRDLDYVKHETRNTIHEIRGILDGALAWVERRNAGNPDDADLDAIADARRKLGHVLAAVADVETMIKHEDEIDALTGDAEKNRDD